MALKMHFDLPSGFKIPAVGLGTSKSMGDDLEKALDEALEIGYRHIDTAFVYNNEETIGKVLKKWFDSGKITREELFITTKLPFYGTSPLEIEKSLSLSLEKLQLEYVDLYLIHFPVTVELIDENQLIWKALDTDYISIWKVLEQQVDKGKIKSIGISNFNKKQIEKLMSSGIKHKISNLQVELHIYLQQKELVRFCHGNNITVTAYGPLGSRDYIKFSIKNGRMLKNMPDILNDEKTKKISKKYNKTSAQIVLKFLLQNSIIVIPKSVNPKRLKENFDLFNFELDEKDFNDLKTLEKGEKGRIFNFIEFKGVSTHPEWPFVKEDFNQYYLDC